MQLRYSFRLYPNTSQRQALAKAFGCARVVFNDVVHAREAARAAGGAFPKAGELSRRLITEAKRTEARSWLAEVSSVVLQQSLRDADAAYRNYFASLKGTRKGPKIKAPRFKSRKDSRQSIRFTANACWSITPSARLNLPKIGAVKVKWSRRLPNPPSSVTVVKEAAGRYFASSVINTDPQADATHMPASGQSVGIDLGLTHFAVLPNGTRVSSPRFLRRAERNIKKAQRELSRKEKGSKNREKARIKLARAHAKVTDARHEFHHQLSTQLIRDNQAIGVEDLAVKALARTRLAKSIHDAGWTAFVNMLEYKANRYGRNLIKIGRFEPTSQTCSACGYADGPRECLQSGVVRPEGGSGGVWCVASQGGGGSQRGALATDDNAARVRARPRQTDGTLKTRPKPLHIRQWTCAACAAAHDRDINAAINILTAAELAVTACGAPVGPESVLAQRDETGSHGFFLRSHHT